MIPPAHPRRLGCLLLLAAVLVTGCERLRTLATLIKQGGNAQSVTTGTYTPEQVTALDDSTYDAFIAQKSRLIIVDFYADWCGPCKKLGPMLERAAAAHPGVVYVGRVNVDQAAKLAAANQVRGIPDVHIFKEGREVDHFIGCPSEAEVMAKIAALAEGITAVVAEPAKPDKPVEETIRPMPKDWMPPGIRKRQ
ncbi:MAG: thioredoxin domain-containing protein [Verrucomicrobiota bacterium]